MSKSSKTRRAMKRRQDKRNRKKANQEKWQAFAHKGENCKSKRNQLNSKRKRQVRVIRHRLGPCGNAGCKQCLDLNLTKYYAKRERIRQNGELK